MELPRLHWSHSVSEEEPQGSVNTVSETFPAVLWPLAHHLQRTRSLAVRRDPWNEPGRQVRLGNSSLCSASHCGAPLLTKAFLASTPGRLPGSPTSLRPGLPSMHVSAPRGTTLVPLHMLVYLFFLGHFHGCDLLPHKADSHLRHQL